MSLNFIISEEKRCQEKKKKKGEMMVSIATCFIYL